MGSYHAPGLSYATKELSPDSLKVYLERLSDLAKMLGKSGNLSREKLAEWVVLCCEQSVTRWEGAWEFCEWPLLQRGETLRDPLDLRELTEKQRARLVDILADAPEIREAEAILARVLTTVPDERLDARFERYLKSCVESGTTREAIGVMRALVTRRKWAKGQELLDMFRDFGSEDGRLEVLRQFLKKLPPK